VGGPGNGTTYAGTLIGTTGNDVIVGAEGKDSVDAKAGNDTICGLGGDDQLTADAGTDYVDGGIGNDTLKGSSGDDTLIGGGKADIMSGGTGNDNFVYRIGLGAGNESAVGAADHITDFQVGDHIDVSAIDADGNAGNGNSQFTFSNGGATTQAGKFWFEQHDDGQHVFFNINGGAADMEIILDNNHQFTAADFHL
jgi:Ca2+-binding RTX toxin-like protein